MENKKVKIIKNQKYQETGKIIETTNFEKSNYPNYKNRNTRLGTQLRLKTKLSLENVKPLK